MDAGPPSVTRRQRLQWGLEVFLVLAAVWLALDGLHAWPLGLLAAAAGAAAGVLLAPGRPYRWRPLRLLAFCAYFVVESLRGGLDVAWRALHPRLPVQPGFTEMKLSLPPGPPRTLMLSVVSLLPGTLSADLDPERNILCVHLLAPEMARGLAPLEARIARLFGLEADP